MLLLFGIAAFYAAPALSAEGLTRNFNVPAQSARKGILQFARQAGIQVLVPTSDAAMATVGSVTGGHTVEDGLRQLIAPSPLRLVSFNGRTAVLARRAVQPESGGSSVAQPRPLPPGPRRRPPRLRPVRRRPLGRRARPMPKSSRRAPASRTATICRRR